LAAPLAALKAPRSEPRTGDGVRQNHGQSERSPRDLTQPARREASPAAVAPSAATQTLAALGRSLSRPSAAPLAALKAPRSEPRTGDGVRQNHGQSERSPRDLTQPARREASPAAVAPSAATQTLAPFDRSLSRPSAAPLAALKVPRSEPRTAAGVRQNHGQSERSPRDPTRPARREASPAAVAPSAATQTLAARGRSLSRPSAAPLAALKAPRSEPRTGAGVRQNHGQSERSSRDLTRPAHHDGSPARRRLPFAPNSGQSAGVAGPIAAPGEAGPVRMPVKE
jgi:hypothetical protein